MVVPSVCSASHLFSCNYHLHTGAPDTIMPQLPYLSLLSAEESTPPLACTKLEVKWSRCPMWQLLTVDGLGVGGTGR